PTEDKAPASLLPPGFLTPRIRPLSPRVLGAKMNAIALSLYHSLHPSGTPPLLLISTPSTSRRARIPEADTPPRNRPLLATPRLWCEVEESSATAARRPWLIESIAKDRAAVRAEIEVLRSERLAYEQEENPRNMHTARPCYYADFMKCHPLNFKGTEGTVGLTCWIKKMESVFNISGCAVENQSVLKKKLTDKYCSLGEVKKLEIKLWNLKVRDNDIPAYTNRFQELALICRKFVSNETKKVNKYISGLPDNIYQNVKSSKPKTLDKTIELANDLMDQKLRTYAERKSDSKRKADASPETTKNLSRSRMSRKHTTWDLLRKRPKREMRPSVPSANAITLARAL
nr:hypothetical protein [Tanacetum cinerariifolium]